MLSASSWGPKDERAVADQEQSINRDGRPAQTIYHAPELTGQRDHQACQRPDKRADCYAALRSWVTDVSDEVENQPDLHQRRREEAGHQNDRCVGSDAV